MKAGEFKYIRGRTTLKSYVVPFSPPSIQHASAVLDRVYLLCRGRDLALKRGKGKASCRDCVLCQYTRRLVETVEKSQALVV